MLRERWRRADSQAAEILESLSRSPALPSPGRLRASAGLLANPPESFNWNEAAPGLAGALVEAPAHELSFWIETFRPLQNRLRPEMSKLFFQERTAASGLHAAASLAAWAEDEIDSVIRAVVEADASSFPVFVPALTRHREDGSLRCLGEKLRRPRCPKRKSGSASPDGVQRELDNAQGLAGVEYALCSSLPRDRFSDVASQHWRPWDTVRSSCDLGHPEKGPAWRRYGTRKSGPVAASRGDDAGGGSG